MKQLLLIATLAACGGTPNAVPVSEPAPLASTPATPSTSPTDVADRKHAFAILPSELHWEGKVAAISDDIKFEKFQEGGGFDVNVGPAVVVQGDVRNEKNEPVIAWNQKAHRLICNKGGDCLIAVHSNVTVAPSETRTSDLAWKQLDPARPDPLVAPLWGDGATGPNGFLMKMKAGGGPFWHIHKRDYHGVVLAGTVVSYESGKQPREMPPGSYWWQPNGNKHTTDCKGPQDCVIYLDFTGAFDVKPVP